MDGFSYIPVEFQAASLEAGTVQHTLKATIGCAGVGLHSGQAVTVRLLPGEAGTGVLFARTDLGTTIPAQFDTVVDTRLCTVVGNDGGARVGTIEHLMAALAALGIDNIVVEVDGPELPVLDGSAEPWMFLLGCAGIVEQAAPRRVIEILRTVRAEDGDAFAELRPSPGGDGLELALSIAFDAAAIGHQAMTMTLEAGAFGRELARARTFALKHEIEGLQRAGLARGGSLENAIVVDGDRVLNPAGLRMTNEFVRHKLLDAVGDLALGGALRGRFVGHKSGHALNNKVLRVLFSDSANWRATEGHAAGSRTVAGLLAA